jgi:hypothetical protein
VDVNGEDCEKLDDGVCLYRILKSLFPSSLLRVAPNRLGEPSYSDKE